MSTQPYTASTDNLDEEDGLETADDLAEAFEQEADEPTATEGETPRAATSSRAGDSTAAAARKAAAEKSLIKRTARKVLEIQDADEKVQALLASLLKVKNQEVEDLTVAVMTADRSALSALNDVSDLAKETDTTRRALSAAMMERGRRKALWSVLNGLGRVGEDIPASDVDAAYKIAGALDDIGKDGLLEQAIAVSKRGW